MEKKLVKSKLEQFFSGFLKQLLWHKIETIGLFLYFVQWRFDIILSHHGITLGPSSLSYCNLRGKFEFSNWVDGCIWGTSRCGEVIWSSTSVNLLDWMIKSLKKKMKKIREIKISFHFKINTLKLRYSDKSVRPFLYTLSNNSLYQM